MTLFYSPSRKSFSLIALFLLFFCGVFFGGIKESRAACTVTSWTPYVSTVCSGTSFTQTSNCGTTRSATGTMIGTWSPAPSTVCSGTSYTQTSSCGLTQTNTGTKCCDTSWSPATSGTCSDTTLTQTSNCSNTRTVSGTLNCLVNGSCGAAATTYAYNASGYSGAACSTGTGSLPAFPAAGSSASWTCSGAHGGSSPSCTATRNPTPVNGSCGAAATTYAYNASGYSGAACSTGTGSLPAFPAAGSSSTWTCAGSNGGSSSGTCTATRNPTPVNGSCGTGATTYAYNATAYTGSACATGSGSFPAFPSAGSSSTWTCSGLNGGSSSGTCTATRNPTPVNGLCGAAATNYTSGTSAFSGSACSVGSGSLPVFPSAGSSASWSCTGSNGGSTASCTATRDPYVCGGSVPLNGTAYNGTNLTGLTVPTNYSYANPNTVAKCEFSCNAGYDWDGSSCVAPPTINTFSATPSSISPGGSTTLTWDTTGVVTSGCTASGGTWSGTKAKTNLTGNTVSGINTTTTYTISCVNSAGVPASASVTVTVVPNPTVSLTAAPTTVIQGSSTLLTWSSTNAVYPCVSTGGWTGSSRVVNNSTGVSSVVTANTTYTLTCSNSIGVSASDSATVTALVPVNGVCGSANKTYTSGVTSFGSDIACSSGTGSLPIFPAAGSTATWACSGINTGTNASCTVSRDPYVCSGTVPSHATAYTGTNLTGLTTPVGYTYANPNTVAKCEFSCNAGYDWDGVSCVPPPTVTLTATPVSIATGTNTLLTWSSTNTIGSCTASGGWAGSSRALNNSTGANPGTITADTTYTLTCHNSANVTASDSVTVTAVPNPTVTLTATPTAVIIGNSPTLTWSSTNTVSPCISSGSTAWNSPSRSRSNSTGVAPGGITTSTTYTMTCSNSVGVSASDSVTVTILPNTAQPPIITDLSGNGSPITISKGQSTGFRFHSAPDVEGNNVYYEVDWDNDGVSDGITPTSGYVTPATIQETAHTWATSGSYTFKVRTKDNSATDPAVSEWVPFTVNVAVFAICPFAVTVGVGEAGIQAVGWYGIGAKCSSHPGAIDVTMTANWTSSATGIATVTNTITDKGWVVGKNVGIATITSTYLGQTDTIAVTSVVNGQCSTSVKNSCIRGVFFDTTDSMANYIWMCNGSGG